MNKYCIKALMCSGRFWIIVGIVVIGIFFRFYQIDNKIFWGDESRSLIYASNIGGENIRAIYNNSVITKTDIIKILSQPRNYNVLDIARSTTADSSKRPLYYVLGFWWTRVFSPTFLGLRSLSAFLGILMLPALWWLYKEALGEGMGAVLCLALLAVSPFYVIYSQEARPYTLWYLLTLVSSASFLRALRFNSKIWWGLYAIAVILGMLAFFLFIAVFAGHLLYYIFFTDRTWIKKIKTVVAIFSTFLIGSLFYLIYTQKPYFYLSHHHLKKWLSIPHFVNPAKITTGLNKFFIDVSPAGGVCIGNDGIKALSFLSVPIFILFILLISYSFFILLKSKVKNRFFFLIMPLVSGIIFLSSQRLTLGLRFYGAAFLFILCVLAFSLSNNLRAENRKKRAIWIVITSFILISGLISCVLQSQNKIWWNKHFAKTKFLYDFSQHVNNSRNPLIVSDAKITDIVTFSSIMTTETKYLLIDRDDEFVISDEYDLFLFNPSPELMKIIVYEKGYLIQDLNDKVYGQKEERKDLFFKIKRSS